MKISQKSSIRQDWDQVKSWNYKLKHLPQYQSVVYAELNGIHGEVHTNDLERIYFIIEGEGKFTFNNQAISVNKGDVISIPAHTTYDYQPLNNTILKVVLFMELWNN